MVELRIWLHPRLRLTKTDLTIVLTIFKLFPKEVIGMTRFIKLIKLGNFGLSNSSCSAMNGSQFIFNYFIYPWGVKPDNDK